MTERVQQPKRHSSRSKARAALRRAVGQERSPAGLPRLQRHPDVDVLVGESEYSVAQAGERSVTSFGRAPGGPPRLEPQVPAPEEVTRRFMEDLTEAPAQDQFDPEPPLELELEEESESLPEDVRTR
jgi:hypothetical protein